VLRSRGRAGKLLRSITSNLYDAAQTGSLPEDAVLASLGCGTPTALAELRAGETVSRSWIGRRDRMSCYPHGAWAPAVKPTASI